MSSGDMSKRIHNLWKKAGIFEGREIPKNLNCNILRKSTVTAAREHSLGRKQDIADTMSHSTTTADAIYHLRDREKTASAGAEAIRSHFLRTPTKIISSPETARSPRVDWEIKDIEFLRKLFAPDIADGYITMARIKETRLNWVSIKNTSERQIYDKVRNLIMTLNVTKKNVSIFIYFYEPVDIDRFHTKD